MIWEVDGDLARQVRTQPALTTRDASIRVNSRQFAAPGGDFLSSRSPHVPTMFNAISFIAATSFLLPVCPPAALSARKSLGRGARSNKLQLLESTFELRLGRARYDNQRNPVSRIATVMNSSDVAGSAREEDAIPPSGVQRDAIESVHFTRPRWKTSWLLMANSTCLHCDLLGRRAIVFPLTIPPPLPPPFIPQNLIVSPEGVFLLSSTVMIFAYLLLIHREARTCPEMKYSDEY